MLSYFYIFIFTILGGINLKKYYILYHFKDFIQNIYMFMYFLILL